jgi:hypothetical protein
MNYQIGQHVELNGKTYKIVGTVKRSWLLEKDGKQYKATSKMMGKIKNQNKWAENVDQAYDKEFGTPRLDQRLAYRKIFDKEAKMPETHEELMTALDTLCGELSPENLSCDGECSRSQVASRRRALNQEWREIEKKLGHKVSMNEAEGHWIDNIRKQQNR